jgi:uncharacterized protein
MSLLSEATKRVVLVDNPWLQGEEPRSWFQGFVPDPYVERRAALTPGAHATLVVGPRQAGKSTLIWRSQSTRNKPFLYLNGDEPAIRTWLTSPALFLEDVRALVGSVPDLFFEEVQRLEEPGLFLKGLVDRKPGVAIFATGSSSFELEAKTRESLAGRADRHLLLPFGLEERLSRLGPFRDRAPLAIEAARRRELVAAMTFGGFPAVVTSEDPASALAKLVEAYVIRDASDRFKIRHVAAFRKVLELAASQIGALVNFSEWAAIAGVSNDTVADYVQLAEATHVLKLVPPFVGGRRAEITSTPKAYYIDNGIRNQLFGGFSGLSEVSERADRGAVLENLVFTEIWKSMNPLLDALRFWRSKSGAEMDFVVEHRGRILAIEVKAGDPRGRVTRSARSFLEAYQPESLLIVSPHQGEVSEVAGVPVHFVAPWEIAPRIRAFSAS